MTVRAPQTVAVLDTNVYVSGVISSRGAPHDILRAWREQVFTLATSELILDEIERVLAYPHLRDRYSVSASDVAQLIQSLREDTLVVAGALEVVGGVASDPDDDIFLACALEARAGYIVSGDPHLLNLGRYQGVVMIRPAEFLAILA